MATAPAAAPESNGRHTSLYTNNDTINKVFRKFNDIQKFVADKMQMVEHVLLHYGRFVALQPHNA